MQWLVLRKNNKSSLLKIGDTAIILDEDISPKQPPLFKLHNDMKVVVCHPVAVKGLFQKYKKAVVTKEPVPYTPEFTPDFNGPKCIILDEQEFFSFIK